MAKKIAVVPPKPRASKPASMDKWIGGGEAKQGGEPLVRLTFDISESLHERIKRACIDRKVKRMAIELRRILEKEFPE
jgi:hypothetical protein